jgi:NarL family two-component system response regulator LiaR
VLRELDRSGGPRAAQDQGLTERELAVLGRLAQGFSNQEIADALVISERTVRTHVSNILSKLHLANRTQAALYALKEGLAKLGDAELG